MARKFSRSRRTWVAQRPIDRSARCSPTSRPSEALGNPIEPVEGVGGQEMGVGVAEEVVELPGDLRESRLADDQLPRQVHELVEPLDVDADRLGDPLLGLARRSCRLDPVRLPLGGSAVTGAGGGMAALGRCGGRLGGMAGRGIGSGSAALIGAIPDPVTVWASTCGHAVDVGQGAESRPGSVSETSQIRKWRRSSASSNSSAGGSVARMRALAASRFRTSLAFMSGQVRFGSKRTVRQRVSRGSRLAGGGLGGAGLGADSGSGAVGGLVG